MFITTVFFTTTTTTTIYIIILLHYICAIPINKCYVYYRDIYNTETRTYTQNHLIILKNIYNFNQLKNQQRKTLQTIVRHFHVKNLKTICFFFLIISMSKSQ